MQARERITLAVVLRIKGGWVENWGQRDFLGRCYSTQVRNDNALNQDSSGVGFDNVVQIIRVMFGGA